MKKGKTFYAYFIIFFLLIFVFILNGIYAENINFIKDGQGRVVTKIYLDDPSLNVYYTYDVFGHVKTIEKNNIITKYDYNPVTLSLSETTIVDGLQIPKIYYYNPSGRVIGFSNLLSNSVYTLNNLNQVIYETTSSYDYFGNLVFQNFSYVYDSFGNVLSISDGDSIKNFSYETYNYGCKKTVCIDYSSINATLLLNCSITPCVPYNCSSYQIVDSNCSYTRIKTESIENDVVVFNYDSVGLVSSLCSVVSGACLNVPSPLSSLTNLNQSNSSQTNLTSNVVLSSINSENIFSDRVYNYTYDSNGRLIRQEALIGNMTKVFQYSLDGFLKSSNFSIVGLGNFTMDFKLDGLGRPIKKTVKYPKDYFFNSSNLSEGYSPYVFPNGSFFVDYYSLDDGKNYVTKDKYDDYYFKFRQRVPIDNLNYCLDFDADEEFENSTFTFSSVWFNGEIYYDSCENEDQVREYYCGLDLIRWDFWNAVTKRALKSRVFDCKSGCLNGACLVLPLGEKNQTVEVNQTLPPCPDLNLPSEPGMPGGEVIIPEPGVNCIILNQTNQTIMDLPAEPIRLG